MMIRSFIGMRGRVEKLSAQQSDPALEVEQEALGSADPGAGQDLWGRSAAVLSGSS